jgi:hypothetical protein
LLKTSAITGTTSVTNVYNQSAQFVDPSTYNFKLGVTSAAKGIGTNIYQTPYPITQTDITGSITRDPLHPSAGAYE